MQASVSGLRARSTRCDATAGAPVRRVLPARVASLCATTRLGRDRKDVVTSAFSIGLTTADNKELADQVDSFLERAGKNLDEPKTTRPPNSVGLFQMMPYLMGLAASAPRMQWRLIAAILCMVVSKGIGMTVPVFFKQAVDALAAGPVTEAMVQAAVTAIVLSGVAKAVSGAAKELQMVVFTPLAQAVGRQVAFSTFKHLLSLDAQFHLENKTGSLARILERGTRAVYMIFRSLVFTFIPTAVELVLVCALLAKAFNPTVAGAVVLTFLAYSAFTVSTTTDIANTRKVVNAIENEMSAKTVDALINIETVSNYNNGALEVRKFNQTMKANHDAGYVSEVASCSLNAGQGIILAAGVTAVLTLGIVSCAAGTMTVGDLVMANALMLQLWAPLQFLGWFYRELRQSLVDMEQLGKILNTKSQLPDGTEDLPPSNSATPGVSVSFENVTFSYPNTKKEVCKNINLDIKAGQSVAFVGPTGAGKSSLIRLLLRTYDTDSGTVTINGADVRTLKRASVRDVTAVVPQDAVLLNGTILENIQYGRPDATFNEVVQAAKAAELHEAILRMNDGWETVVGERGLKLSGGEKQRVAIARAFLRNPQLLICDEATSALDSGTEASIMSSLQDISRGRTTIFIAHRLSTIKQCDRIYVMKKGVIEESGTHKSLMEKGGLYAAMWALQQEEDEINEMGMRSLGIHPGDYADTVMVI